MATIVPDNRQVSCTKKVATVVALAMVFSLPLVAWLASTFG